MEGRRKLGGEGEGKRMEGRTLVRLRGTVQVEGMRD